MSKFLLVVLAVGLCWADSSRDGEYQAWAKKYRKAYSEEELPQRRALWERAFSYVDQQNKKFESGVSTFKVELNKFADWSPEEKQRMLGYRAGAVSTLDARTFKYENVDPPPSVDWVKAGKVTGVKDQGQCGSCWAFSAVGSIEGVAAINTNHTWPQGTITGFSEMQIVQCDKTKDDQGCNGGEMTDAFQYVMKNGGLNAEEDYPYEAMDTKCNPSLAAVKVATVQNFAVVPPKNFTALKQAVAMQPVSVAVDANCDAWMYYQSGILSESCGTELDHGVLVTGYTADPKHPNEGHWIVKNSWGEDWGNAGYVWLSWGGASEGIDGILLSPSFPTGAGMPKPYSPPKVCGRGAIACQTGTTCCCSKKDLLHLCTAYQCCAASQTCTIGTGCS